MKTYFEWNYDEKPPVMKVVEVAAKIDRYHFTRRAIYMNGGWFDNETLRQLPQKTSVYAWAHIPAPPPVDIDTA